MICFGVALVSSWVVTSFLLLIFLFSVLLFNRCSVCDRFGSIFILQVQTDLCFVCLNVVRKYVFVLLLVIWMVWVLSGNLLNLFFVLVTWLTMFSRIFVCICCNVEREKLWTFFLFVLLVWVFSWQVWDVQILCISFLKLQSYLVNFMVRVLSNLVFIGGLLTCMLFMSLMMLWLKKCA